MSFWEPAKSCWGAPHSRGSRDVFEYVMTPDRIPQFTIPSLDIHGGYRFFRKGKEQPWRPGSGQSEWKARRSSSDPIRKQGCAVRGSVPCCSSPEMATRVEDIPDPVTRAALSLPHLPKITTPYGFITLGESPQMTNEEALFFYLDLASSRCPGVQKHPDNPERPESCQDSRTPIAHTECHSWMGGCLRGCRMHGFQRPKWKGSKGSQGCDQPASLPRISSSPIRDSQVTDVVESGEAEDKQKSLPLETVCHRSYSSQELQAKKPKRNFFQRILKKHFVHLRLLKSRNFPLH